jgi:hypothetical protein
MANLTESLVRAFAHCPDPRCPGNEQEPVDGVLRVTEVLYTDNDPNGIPGVEKSYETLSFAEEEQAPCEHCELYREISTQKRPQYDSLSGQDARELLRRQDLERQGKDAELVRLQAENAALRAGVAPAPAAGEDVGALIESMKAEHAEQMEALRQELATKVTKSGPKPKASGV